MGAPAGCFRERREVVVEVGQLAARPELSHLFGQGTGLSLVQLLRPGPTERHEQRQPLSLGGLQNVDEGGPGQDEVSVHRRLPRTAKRPDLDWATDPSAHELECY